MPTGSRVLPTITEDHHPQHGAICLPPHSKGSRHRQSGAPDRVPVTALPTRLSGISGALFP
ncbi:hypothetical protein, partial [Candidatus Thiosymbion oneisti]|uniref:hypothetical protein n=1 Tax=Candidatus Thiosymbion oneisti TaxID=589554 RepID=UPI001C4048CD